MEIFLFIFPLISFFIFQFQKLKIKADILYGLNIFFMLLTFVLSIYIFIKILNFNNNDPLYLYPIIKLDDLFLDWSLRFDLFVSSLIVFITFIVLLLSIYSINFPENYMTNVKINSLSSFSIFSVMLLLTSNNLIQFFIGWYLLILSSYLLSNISENKNRIIDNSNIFFQNRISDLCFFLSLYFIYTFSNSTNFDVIFKSNGFENNISILNKDFSNFNIAIFILFFSFLLRCRQFYISNSKYDLLNINTSSYSLILYGLFLPVGLYFILRFLILTQSSLDYLNVLLILGSTLTFIFSIFLIRSYSLKKLTIYIASAQFGILLILVSLKLYSAVVFYFFISTISLVILSLSFGIISSKLNNEQDIRKMGYLIIKCPSIFLFILIGFVSLLGIPYFSGFYSNQLIFFQSSLIIEENYTLIFTYCVFYTFIISYVSFKIILIVFLGENNCNIHLYNKIEEGSYYLKFIIFVLSVFVIFLGWYFNNLFSGNFGVNLWRSVLVADTNFSINHDYNNNNQFLFEVRYIICYFGIFLAFLNYLIIPKLGNNLKLNNNKLFKYYLKSFTSHNFNK